MSLAVDLMGVGVPQEQAARLGFSQLTTVAGVGTSQIGAAPVRVNNVLATTAGGQTAFILPADAELEVPYLITNSTATTALVFPHVGGAINAASTDASVGIAQNLGRMFIRKTATRWASFLTA